MLSARNPESNITILSGDLSQNHTGSFGNRSDNSYHVVSAGTTNSTARLDGFRIIGGNAVGSAPNGQGGGAFLDNASCLIARCVFSGNSALHGGAICWPNSGRIDSVAIEDCTFSANTAFASGGGGANYSEGTANVENSILWDNSPNQYTASGGGTVVFAYSNIQGNGLVGSNIDNDPLFIDADGTNNGPGDLNDDLRLACSSPSINRGSAAGLPGDVADLDLNASTTTLPLDVVISNRIIGLLDHGAYEKPATGCLTDFDQDGDVDVADLLTVITHWGACASPPPATCVGDVQGPCLNQGNGTVNVQDLLAVISTWGNSCGGTPEDMPRTVQDCMNLRAPLGIGTPEYADCVEKCVNSLP